MEAAGKRRVDVSDSKPPTPSRRLLARVVAQAESRADSRGEESIEEPNNSEVSSDESDYIAHDPHDSEAEGSAAAEGLHESPAQEQEPLQMVIPRRDGMSFALLAEDQEIEIEMSHPLDTIANKISSRGRFIRRCAILAGVDLKNRRLKYSIKPVVENSTPKYLIRFYELKKAPKARRSLPEESPAMVKNSLGSWTVYEVSAGFGSEKRSHTPSTHPCRFQIPALVDSSMVRRWLEDCSECSGHSSASVTSVARLQQARAEYLLRAIHTSSGKICPLPEGAKFAVLSYVWGAKARLQETEPPQTVKDATSFAASIGIEWLWVDRMCIKQDDHEKARLIPLMKDIFALAEVTIVAADGHDASSGLVGVSSRREKESLFKHRKLFEGATVLPATYSFNALFDSCIWRTRGWTLQEHIFSRRLLFFFDTEVVFGCGKGTYRESTGMKFTGGGAGSTWGGGGANPPVIEGQLQAKLSSAEAIGMPEIETEEFLRAVRDYTKRQLTFEEDRIDAFSGLILTSMSESAEWKLLLHGHPPQFFESALTWQQENVPDDDTLLRRSSTGQCFAPSWSWASAGTEVRFLEDYNAWLFEYSMINSIDIYGTINDKFIPGFLRNAAGSQKESLDTITKAEHKTPRLHLLTLVFEAKRRRKEDGTYTPSVDYPEKAETSIDLGSVSFTLDRRPSSQESSEGKEVYAVVGRGKNVYIMLLGQTKDDAGVYFRKALFPVQLGFLGAFIRHVSLRWEYIMIE